jgi:hypothetical protein
MSVIAIDVAGVSWLIDSSWVGLVNVDSSTSVQQKAVLVHVCMVA